MSDMSIGFAIAVIAVFIAVDFLAKAYERSDPMSQTPDIVEQHQRRAFSADAILNSAPSFDGRAEVHAGIVGVLCQRDTIITQLRERLDAVEKERKTDLQRERQETNERIDAEIVQVLIEQQGEMYGVRKLSEMIGKHPLDQIVRGVVMELVSERDQLRLSNERMERALRVADNAFHDITSGLLSPSARASKAMREIAALTAESGTEGKG